MTRLRFALLIAFTLVIGATSRGDTVVLKSGERIEGKILSETDAEVKIETRAGGIVDERTVPKADIAKVEKVTPDEVAWQPLKTLQPGANSLPATQYDRVLTLLRSFASQFPQSTHMAEAQKALAAFEEEKKRVDAGELKLQGKWITKEEVQKERYQINALVALNYLREQQARGDVMGALNTFEVLERDYPGAKVYPDAVEAALRILPAMKAQAAARVAALPAEKDAQAKAIERALEPSKSDMKAAGEREKAMADAALSAAQKQGVKWPPFHPKSEESMKLMADRANGELSRLAALDLGRMRQSVQLATKAAQALEAKDVTAAEEALTQAKELWDANELTTRLAPQLASAKTQAAEEPMPESAETEAAKNAAAAISPTSTATVSSASSEPVSSDEAAPPEEAVGEEPAPVITPFRVVFALVLFVFLFAMWKAYKSVKSKANEVLE